MKKLLPIILLLIPLCHAQSTIPSAPNSDGSINHDEMYALSVSYLQNIVAIHPFTPGKDGIDWKWEPDVRVILVRQSDGKSFTVPGMQHILVPRTPDLPKDAIYVFFVAPPEAGIYQISTVVINNDRQPLWKGLPFTVTLK